MKCKICKNKTEKIVDTELKKTFWHCLNCKFIFLDDEFFIDNLNEKKQYDQHNNSLENLGYVDMFEKFLDFCIDSKKLNCALDFGSGPTPVLATLLKQRVTKVDYYDKFYQPKKIYENRKYDLITSTEVFEHLQNPKKELELLASCLKKGGKICIMTLFHNNSSQKFLKWWYRRDPTHICFYTPKTFEVLADMCDLKIFKTDKKRIIILTT